MAPAASETWSDANKLKFVTLIAYALGGSPAQHWPEIAEKMGPNYTATSLRSSWQRIRAQVAKEGGVGEGKGPSTPAKVKKAAAPKKTAAAEDGGEEKPKRGRKRKADSASPVATPEKKVKEEAGEEPEDEIKGEPEAGADEI